MPTQLCRLHLAPTQSFGNPSTRKCQKDYGLIRFKSRYCSTQCWREQEKSALSCTAHKIQLQICGCLCKWRRWMHSLIFLHFSRFKFICIDFDRLSRIWKKNREKYIALLLLNTWIVSKMQRKSKKKFSPHFDELCLKYIMRA